ncbi:hypothetical protein J5T34_02725 [Cupriavidus gilardii]|uniref:hypothetical protein n=1 Tax=Cupriavidus gilardii TaxID=82541 RepID=UPI001ABDAC90|nr:hypothetical protein [Cupriavidus gilardii]MBO4119650.1 hypothetical protein [Cupriavidus gilardii]
MDAIPSAASALSAALSTASAPSRASDTGALRWRTGSCDCPPLCLSNRRWIRHRGYLLLESLVALALLGIGLLPLAWLGPTALQWWREPLLIGQALRLAAEGAELAGLAGLAGHEAVPDLARLPALAQRPGLPSPRWCATVPADAQSSCPAGLRVVVVGPLPSTPGIRTEAGDAPPGTALRAIALRLRP